LPDYNEVSGLLERDAARLARHYDAIIVTAAEDQVSSGLPGRLPVPNVVYCARMGRTRLSALRSAVDGIRLAGGRPLGVVLWDGELPEVMSPQELATRPRAQRTTEMQALSTSR
jgi:hypothetical protein